jgi:hypothetical protein
VWQGSCLENSSTRICDLILGPPFGRVRLADSLEEAIRQLQAKRREAVAELEGLRSSAARVQDLVLGGPARTSSLAVLLSLAAELIEDHINIAASNGVHWGAPVGMGHCLVTLPRTRDKAGAAWV